ncbi:MAG TPA: response regulator transcription factor [Pseudogracilibacillus sp.]|nr:response regulator transcription factor [Pseudogracilibacillus sp.]
MNSFILIVEDEPSIVTLIEYNLLQAGYQTDIARTGEEALHKISQQKYDLVLLDIMLPKGNGLEICQSLREKRNMLPIIMLTAKNTEEDRILGLELGADDYVTKPFSVKELLKRVDVILKRVKEQTEQDNTIQHRGILLNPQKYEVQVHGEKVALKRKEFELLQYFMTHTNAIHTRSALLKQIWGFDFLGDTRIVDVQISNLREKIELDKRNPVYIKTVRGQGYLLEE